MKRHNLEAGPRPLTGPEQIANSITHAILNGELEPGTAIREQELAERFHVSRGPIREGLRILERIGVVTIVPQRGAHVTRLSSAEISDLYEIRAALARVAVRRMGSIRPELLDEIERQVDALEEIAHLNEGRDEFAARIFNIANLVFNATENEKLPFIMESLSIQTARYTRMGLQREHYRRLAITGWRKMVAALRAHDLQSAADVVVALIDQIRAAVVETLTPTSQAANLRAPEGKSSAE